MSRPTIKQNLGELTDLGLIYESGSFGHTGGRRAKVYSIVAKSRVAVGVDLTRHHITILSKMFDGNLSAFFLRLDEEHPECLRIWNEYLKCLSIAVNNIRMLFDCKVILGGYVGAYLEKYLPELRNMAAKRNTFEDNADYLRVCKVKKEALALGSALPFIHEFHKKI